MANFLFGADGSLIGQQRADTSTTKKHRLGMKATDELGNEYVYLQGIGSTVAGSVVVYDPLTYITALADKTEVDKYRPIAVAQSANVANQYGWYCIYGVTEASVLADCAKDVQLYTSGTAGSLDDTSTSQSGIAGFYQMDTADSASADIVSCHIIYPHIVGVR